jgi:hypothetical protein
VTYLHEPKFRSRRYILRTQGLEPVVRRLAEDYGWTLVAERAADNQRGIGIALIWEIIVGLTVGYYDEPPTQVSCLIVRSARDLSEIREYEAFLTRRLDILTDSELLVPPPQMSPGTRGEILFLLRLGFGAPLNFDQRYFDQLSSATQSANRETRDAALRGITYTEWPQFRPVLQQVAKHDSDRSMRKLAKQILSIFDRLGLEEPR